MPPRTSSSGGTLFLSWEAFYSQEVINEVPVDVDRDEMATTWERDNLLDPFVYTWEDDGSLPSGGQMFPSVGAAREAMAIDGSPNGDWLAVGRPDFGGPGQVDLYLKDINGDYQAAQSIVQGSSSGLRYGAALDLDMTSEVLVVGMPRTDPGDNGLVYHYRLIGGTWTLQDFFAAPGGPPDDRFGEVISLSGSWLAVGAPMTDTELPQPLATEVGAVQLYELVSGFFVYRASYGRCSHAALASHTLYS